MSTVVVIIMAALVVALLLFLSIRIVQQYERGVRRRRPSRAGAATWPRPIPPER